MFLYIIIIIIIITSHDGIVAIDVPFLCVWCIGTIFMHVAMQESEHEQCAFSYTLFYTYPSRTAISVRMDIWILL